MTERIRELPDALVLGAGGTLGEAWLRGVLGGLEAGGTLDFRDCEYLLGTSAGSIVAATLAAGKRPEAGEHAAREWAHAAALPDEIGEPGPPRARGREARRRARPRRGPRRQGRGDPVRPARAGDDRARPAGWPAPPSSAARRGPRRTLDGVGALHRRARRALRRPAADRRRRPRARQARDVRRARRAARRRSPRPCSPPARCRGSSRRSRSAGASTSTAASGARRTSTPCPPAAARACSR